MVDFSDPRIAEPDGARGKSAMVGVPRLPILTNGENRAERATSAVFGETVSVYAIQEGFALVRTDKDHYVGWTKADSLVQLGALPTHRISVPIAYGFSKADLKSAPQTTLFLQSHVTVADWHDRFAEVSGIGFVPSAHLTAMGTFRDDPAEIALGFFSTPYLWGGRDALGLDCTGLTQLAFAECGVALPRDSDMQFAWSGEAIEGWNEPEALQRNDLVFWKGHVGIMLNPDTILHANAHHMAVAYEPLAEAIERIAPLYGQPIGAKRVAIDPSARPEWLQT
ncbi:MAG: NlpC/P60 family protein [Pseudomonadota bacterium]